MRPMSVCGAKRWAGGEAPGLRQGGWMECNGAARGRETRTSRLSPAHGMKKGERDWGGCGLPTWRGRGNRSIVRRQYGSAGQMGQRAAAVGAAASAGTDAGGGAAAAAAPRAAATAAGSPDSADAPTAAPSCVVGAPDPPRAPPASSAECDASKSPAADAVCPAILGMAEGSGRGPPGHPTPGVGIPAANPHPAHQYRRRSGLRGAAAAACAAAWRGARRCAAGACAPAPAAAPPRSPTMRATAGSAPAPAPRSRTRAARASVQAVLAQARAERRAAPRASAHGST